MLTREQLKTYHDDGYLLLESFVSPDLLAELNSVADEFVEESRHRGTTDRRIDAVGSAHNLLAALVENAVFRGSVPGLDAGGLMWNRTIPRRTRD